MRHQIKGRKFHRDTSARKALFKSLSIALIEHELIKTTLPKGKDLRSIAEPLITLAKTDSVANRRLAFARLGNDAAVKKLFEVLGPRFKARHGGYLRILKCGFRQGDAAPMCYVEVLEREGVEGASATIPQTKAKKSPALDQVKAEKSVENIVNEEVLSEKNPVKAKTKKASEKKETVE